jgi:hypothetical protein
VYIIPLLRKLELRARNTELHLISKSFKVLPCSYNSWSVNASIFGRNITMAVSNRILIGNFENKRPFGRPNCRWDANIRMVVRETEWEVVTCSHVVQNRTNDGLL